MIGDWLSFGSSETCQEVCSLEPSLDFLVVRPDPARSNHFFLAREVSSHEGVLPQPHDLEERRKKESLRVGLGEIPPATDWSRCLDMWDFTREVLEA